MLANLRSTLRRQSIGVSLGMLAVFIALGSAAVVAQEGGGSGEVRACILPTAGGGSSQPNVRIIGEGESCPSNATPRNWNVQGPSGPQGPIGPQGPPPDIFSSDPPTTGEIAADIGTELPITIKKRVKHADGPSPYKSVNSPPCPESHPKLYGGGYEVRTPNRGGPFHLIHNGAPRWRRGERPRWLVTAAHDPGPGGSWRLTSYILCQK